MMTIDGDWAKFVNVCMAFFQGRDDLIQALLNCPYGEKLHESDKARHSIFYQCIKKIFLYRSHIYFYDCQDEKGALDSRMAGEILLTSRKPGLNLLLTEIFGHDRKGHLNAIRKVVDQTIWDNRLWLEPNIWEEERDNMCSRSIAGSRQKIDTSLYLVAIIAYLLRGYCLFVTGPSTKGKEQTWARLALNDFSQAFYLTQRLPLDTFDAGITAGKCHHDANWLYILIDVFRANVYYKLYDFDGALDSYCLAVKRYEALSPEPACAADARLGPGNVSNTQSHPCKTMAKVYSEKAKCFFENGHFLESLKWHLRALMELLHLSGTHLGPGSLYEDIASVVVYLDHKKEQPTFQKCELRKFFERGANRAQHETEIQDLEASLKDIPKGAHWDNRVDIEALPDHRIIHPDRFKTESILPQFHHIAADVLVRVGFLLYTLREHVTPVGGCDGQLRKILFNLDLAIEKRNQGYILPFFAPENVWPGFETAFGNYCKYVFKPEDPIDLDGFSHNGERLFAAMAFKELQDKYRNHIKKQLDAYHGDLPREDDVSGELSEIGSQLGRTSMMNIDNIVTRPKMLYSYMMRGGYRARAKEIRDGESDNITNKLVVLRRWQSFNPKVPRPRHKHVPGGGYFLMWQENGIVIDPGYNFIQNFYDEGFSLADIDAVVVTHSHPDHDDELSTILTLIYEWNESRKRTLSDAGWGQSGATRRKKGRLASKKIDLFLNEGTYRKYSTWLYAPNGIVNKVYQLQLNIWDSDSDSDSDTEGAPRDQNARGSNMKIDLRQKYGLEMEIVPAWHNEIISRRFAIGLKMRLCKSATLSDSDILVGITGDSHAYNGISNHYRDCDILIAHLGDVKYQEIVSMTAMRLSGQMFADKFFDRKVCPGSKIKELVNLVAHLGLVKIDKVLGRKDTDRLKKAMASEEVNVREIKPIVVRLLEQYPKAGYLYGNHLGIKGVYNLHKSMCEWRGSKSALDEDLTPLLIIGEFPEELGSYRQTVARILNNMHYNRPDERIGQKGSVTPKNRVRCLTGDIGLHIGIDVRRKPVEDTDIPTSRLMLRCHQCNQNSEAVARRLHYHPVENMQEAVIKKEDNSMAYLCFTFKHAMLPYFMPCSFLSSLYRNV